ncbi:hypothetical protein CC2G_003624 [Coprinopsis cinerea AmutBmut pab1-1]|nr:hypothetical protein CC2G_003624 [Coprinopsis cinerea AmutBmut pab1-1]
MNICPHRFLELAHVILVSCEVYRLTIIFYGDPTSLFDFPFLSGAILVAAFVTVLTHGFYASRVWGLLPKPWKWLGPGCMVVSFARFVGGLAAGALGLKTRNVVLYSEIYAWLVISVLVCEALVDMTLAFSMTFYLYKQRRKVMSRSLRLIDRVVQLTVCTGLLTSATSIAFVIAFNIEQNTSIWVAFFTCHARLYSNSMMASLNSRHGLRTMWTEGSHVGFSSNGASTYASSGGGVSGHGKRLGQPPVIAIQMDSSVHRQFDDQDSGSMRAGGKGEC